jgi:hypothetical protein
MIFIFFLYSLIFTISAETSMSTAPQANEKMHWSVPMQTSKEWVRHSNIYADVHAEPEDDGVALYLARYSATAIPRIAKNMGIPVGGPMQIYIANTQETFQAMQPNVPPDWADGTAWPSRGWIFLRSPRIRSGTANKLTQVLEHEIVHILLGRSFAHRPVPRWLQEGVAQFIAGEYNQQSIEQLGSFAEPLSLQELAAGFPSDPFQARMAYAQSADVVAFLYRTNGPQALQTLIYEMSHGTDFDLALYKATGLFPKEFDIAWRGRTYSIPLWIQNFSADTTLLACTGLLLLLGALKKRKDYLKIRPDWEIEEQVHQALVKEMSTWQLKSI